VEDAEDRQKKACAIFSEALRAFRQQSWDEAKEKFGQLIKSGEDGPSRFYVKYCERYKENPPGEGWNRAIPMEEK